jgi:hypothetical protein
MFVLFCEFLGISQGKWCSARQQFVGHAAESILITQCVALICELFRSQIAESIAGVFIVGVPWCWLGETVEIRIGIREILALLNDDGEVASRSYHKPVQKMPLIPSIKVKMPVFSTKKIENDTHNIPTEGGQQGAPSYMQPAMSKLTLNATSNVAEPVAKTKQADPSAPAKKSPMLPRSAKSSPAANTENNSKKPAPRSPFDVQPDVLSIFDQPDVFEEANAIREASRIQQAKKNKVAESPVANDVVKPVEKAAKPEFVFGNPFEGPLPEVFEYDTDLKKSLFDSE